jgi:glycosyltransferase involved in cell wall biosynthesis
VLVGDGAARSALEARATRPPLAGRVTFAGWRTDPWACLGAADLVVFPSLREGLPVALLEAMAAARQVVATRVGDMPRALAEGRLGALVPPADPRALAAALEAGLRGAAHGAPADAAAAHVRRHFGAPAQVHSLESLYRRLARARDAAVA